MQAITGFVAGMLYINKNCITTRNDCLVKVFQKFIWIYFFYIHLEAELVCGQYDSGCYGVITYH